MILIPIKLNRIKLNQIKVGKKCYTQVSEFMAPVEIIEILPNGYKLKRFDDNDKARILPKLRKITNLWVRRPNY